MNHNLLKYLCIFLIFLIIMPSVSAFYDKPTTGVNNAWYNIGMGVVSDNYYYNDATTMCKLLGKIGYNTVFSNLSDSVMISADIYHSLTDQPYYTYFGFSNENNTVFTTDEYCAYFVFYYSSPNYVIGVRVRTGDTVVYTATALTGLSGSEYYNCKIIANSTHITFYINGQQVGQTAQGLGDRTYLVKYITEFPFGTNYRRIKNIYVMTSEIDSVQSSIDIFTPNNIDNATINLVSQVLKIFIDVAKSAVVVGQVIYENIIDITTTVIKIGQSTLTIIAQASAYIYSGILTIIDKVIVAINSFNVLIDSIITTFKTIYDADTVYGSVIKVIPLILVLSIPTIVVYYKIGEFATIPMFMFMSIVAYMTSLMPLWILVVALIGCIAILIQKQRRSN